MNASKCAGVVMVALLVVGLAGGAGEGPVTVTVSEIHLCCGACVKAVEKAVAEVDGVQAEVSQDEGTAVLTAANLRGHSKGARRNRQGRLQRQDRGRGGRAKGRIPRIKTADGKVAKLDSDPHPQLLPRLLRRDHRSDRKRRRRRRRTP